MTCQALEAHQKGIQAVGQLHTAMNQVGQSQTASLRLRILVILETADSSIHACMVKTNFEQSMIH